MDLEDALVEHLRYDGNHNLAVCIACEYALPMEWIEPHFKKIHKLLVMNSLSYKV